MWIRTAVFISIAIALLHCEETPSNFSGDLAATVLFIQVSKNGCGTVPTCETLPEDAVEMSSTDGCNRISYEYCRQTYFITCTDERQTCEL